MTDVLIRRDLLEDLRDAANDCLNHEIMRGNDRNVPAYTELVGQADAALAAPRQPEGEGLEVVGWYHSHAEVATSDKARVVTWLPECIEPLVRLSDHQRAIAELREECERLRKAPVSKADSNAQLVGVCIERDTLRQQRDKLTGLLRKAHSAGRSRRLTVDELYRINAALAEVDK